jgi:Apea-like HEPN
MVPRRVDGNGVTTLEGAALICGSRTRGSRSLSSSLVPATEDALAPLLSLVVKQVPDALQEPPAPMQAVPVFSRGPDDSIRTEVKSELDWREVARRSLAKATGSDELAYALRHIAELFRSDRDEPAPETLDSSSISGQVLEAFIERCLSGAGEKFDVAESFPSAVSAVRAFAAATDVEVTYSALISGVSAPAQSLQLADDVRLLQVSEDERRALWQRLAPRMGVVPPFAQFGLLELADVEARLEVRASFPRDGDVPWPDLQDAVDHAVNTFRLSGPGDVRWIRQWADFGPHDLFLQRLKMSGVLQPAAFAPRAPTPKLTLDTDSTATLFSRIRNAKGALSDHDYRTFDFAVRRFNSMYERSNIEDQLIDCWIAFEALFLADAQQELAYKAGMRIAMFVGDTVDARLAIREKLKRSYDLRSKIVHGVPPDQRGKRAGPLPDRVAETSDTLRAALRHWLDPGARRTPEALDQQLLA